VACNILQACQWVAFLPIALPSPFFGRKTIQHAVTFGLGGRLLPLVFVSGPFTPAGKRMKTHTQPLPVTKRGGTVDERATRTGHSHQGRADAG
jgi:hypothetical protein